MSYPLVIVDDLDIRHSPLLFPRALQFVQSNAPQWTEKETTMDPAKRTMMRVVLLADDREGTADSVERLMGSKAEARFAFISDKAEFAS